MSNFLTKYNQYKHIIVEGTIKTLSYPIQCYILKHLMDKPVNFPYNQLEENEKQFLNKRLEKFKNVAVNEIESLKREANIDLQFESWLYDLSAKWYKKSLDLKPGDIHYEPQEMSYYNTNWYDVPKLYTDWKQICKSVKIDPEYRNIQSFENLQELQIFVKENRPLLNKKIKLDFPLVYSNNKFDIYKVTSKDQQQFQQVYGEQGYDCG